MQTECSPTLFEFEPVERHKVVAGFDGGIITSDAGGLLLGRLDRGLGLIRRMASCFTDRRDPRLLEHTVETLVGQRVFALALGYEDLNDHDELRHDPLFHVLAGKLEAKRSDCAPVAGKSTLNRLEHRPRREAGKYHKIDYDAPSLEALFVDIFLDGHKRAPKEIVLDLDATDVAVSTKMRLRSHGWYSRARTSFQVGFFSPGISGLRSSTRRLCFPASEQIISTSTAVVRAWSATCRHALRLMIMGLTASPRAVCASRHRNRSSRLPRRSSVRGPLLAAMLYG